jgi:hypothetical protein
MLASCICERHHSPGRERERDRCVKDTVCFHWIEVRRWSPLRRIRHEYTCKSTRSFFLDLEETTFFGFIGELSIVTKLHDRKKRRNWM